MNYNNLAQKTNWIGGSDAFPNFQFYLTAVNIPGLTFSLPEIGARGSARLNLGSDTIQYNSLSFDMLVDEDFNIYKEFMNEVIKSITVESGNFADRDFNFYIVINNNKGNPLLKFEFNNCRIESIGDIQLDTQDDMTEYTMNVEIKYDYYKMIEV